MAYTLNLAEQCGFLRVQVSGENDAETVRRYLREVYDVCAKLGWPAVLIEENLTGPSVRPVEAYRVIAEASAQTAPVLLRIAYVDLNPEHSASILELGEAVASDKGVNIRIFRTVAEAEEWLAAE
jgi:hypothetical protein